MAESDLTRSSTPGIGDEYDWFNGHPIAQVDAGSATHWTFTDHLGTPIMQTDSVGTLYWRAEYEPYGAVFSLRTADQHQPLRLRGQQAEQMNLGANGMTERSYNIFKWYQPAWGRYAEADPIGVGISPNLYQYATNDPVVYSDPTGLLTKLCHRRLKLAPCWIGKLHHDFLWVNGSTYSFNGTGGGHVSVNDKVDLNRTNNCDVQKCVVEGRLMDNIGQSISNPYGYAFLGFNCQDWAATMVNLSPAVNCCK